MKKRKLFKRAAALVMAISMIFGVFPFTTFADMKGAGDGAASAALGSVSEIVDKTATPLDENDQTTVTLTVPGEQVNLGVDIIYITGAYLDHDEVEADLMIESLLSTFTEIVGAGIPVNFGYVPFSYDDKPVMDLTSYKTLEDLESLRDDLRTAIGKASGAYGGENMENALQVAKNMLAASPLADHPERQHLVLVASGHTYNFNVGENNEIFSTVPVAIGGSASVGKYFYGYKAWMQARNKNPNSYPIPRPFSTYNDYRDWDAYWRVIDMWAKADVVAGDKVVYNISDTTDPSFTYKNWYTTAYLGRDGDGAPYKAMGEYIHTATQIALDNGYDFANAPISAHGSLIETTIDNVPAAAKHAISYERAMWEASNFIDEQITGVGINFYPIYNQMKPQYTNGVNSNAAPYGYGIDWTTQYIGHSFMDMLARNAGMEKAVNNSTATNKAFFDPIKDKILYTCSEGSYVEDYIGYDAEKGNFEFIQDANTLSVKYGDVVIPAVKIETKAGATASYAFTMDGATAASFNLDYYYGDGTTTEKFIWTFHENVSVAKRAALSYKLQLTDKATEEGTYLPNTNLSATLYPKDSNGNDGEPKVFPIPSVEYIVVDDTYNGPESHDKSKTATPLYGNRFTDVTLSVPGEVETLSTDIVFVIDKSSSDKLSSNFANGLFEQLIEVQKISGASIKVGVVIFNYDGHIALELTELTAENYQTLLTSLPEYKHGTNADAGLTLAKQMLDADEDVDASRKHVIFICDGLTWLFDIDGAPYSVLTKESASSTATTSGTTRWAVGRGVEDGVFPVPGGDWDAYWNKVTNWVTGDRANGDKWIYDFTNYRSETNPINYSSADALASAVMESEYDQHALNMDRAQYEAWETYTALQDAGYNCNAFYTGDSTSNIGYRFMNMLAGSNSMNFDDIKYDILYSVSKGSVIEDYIGYSADEEEGYNFDFVDLAEKLVLKVGETVYTTTKLDEANDGATSSYVFTAPGADEATFALDYFKGNGTTTERFVWTFGENVSRFAPVSLTYTLDLVERSAIPGIHEDVDTNISATLYPKDSDGNDGPAEEFEKPKVAYEVPACKIEGVKLWDDDNNANGLRPDSVTIDLYVGSTKIATTTATAENDWRFSFNVASYLDEKGEPIAYTIVEHAIDQYTVSSIVNPEITISAPVVGALEKHEPCKELEIDIAHTLVVVKKGNDYVVWTLDSLSEDAQQALIPSIKAGANINGNANISFVSGTGNAGFIVEPGKIIFTAKNAWSLIYTGTYTAPQIVVDDASITNALNTIEIDVQKIWDDADDQDGKRPESITVVLWANGNKTNETLTLTAAQDWKGTFIGLVKYDSENNEITYTVTENTVADYEASVEGFVITNKHTPETITIKGSKTWDDADNQDGKRPASITVNLLANGNEIAEKTVGANDGWAWTFENLPKYEGGVEITYTITEDAVALYETTVNGHDITNTHTPETITIEGSKTWDDANNQDGKRPASITVNLLANGNEVAEKTVGANDGWAWTFENLPKYEGGVEITYTITEDAVALYETTVNDYDITNTHTPETVVVSGSKTWNDANNQDGKRPTSITVNLLANGNEVAEKTVGANDGWTWTFENLPKYEGGVEITYTITEDAVKDYSTEVVGYDVINSYTPSQTSVSVSKYWDDANNQDGKRPAFITVVLVKNGTDTDMTLVLNESNQWSGSFTELPEYEAGVAVTYTVKELPVANYSTEIKGNAAEGFVITNTHAPETVEVKVSKTWNDANNQDGKRPASIIIRLYANGKEVGSAAVTEADDWTWTFANLPKYEGGVEVIYTITEDAVALYETTVNGYDITNTHTPETVVVSGSKTWNDANNQDGKRPASITIRLYANGDEIDFVVVGETDDWAWNFENLPKYKNGEEIVYTITEDPVAGYTSDVNGYDVTNSYTPEVVNVSGRKTWNDANNQDGKRPTSIIIRLYANGDEVDAATVTAADSWAWSFNGLAKYENGVEITYTITEDTVEFYSSVVNGYNVTNSYTPETLEISGVKTWRDGNNQDGIRPASVTVNLLANGNEIASVVVNESTQWTYNFGVLDKYADGQLIEYTVTEDAVEGYTAQVNGYNIVNVHTPEELSVSGSKIWKDSNDQDGKRPTSITINLLANGEIVESREVRAEDGWAWSFDNLAKFDDGEEIVYTITENAVENYSTEYDGYNVINSYSPERRSVTVTKVWDDAGNRDGLRPESVEVVLLADGVKTGAVLTLSEENNWTASFTRLPVYNAGTFILYTVEEIAVENYESKIGGGFAEGYVITNTYTPATIEISGSKTWDDMDNKDGIRPASITIQLFANGVLAQSKTVTEADGWAWTFSDLYQNENGEEIVYTIEEIAVEGYTSIVDGYNVTNYHRSYIVIVNYYDMLTQEKIAESYVGDPITEGLPYDVTEKDAIAIDGYTYVYTNGNALSGIMDEDKVINVFYTKIEEIPEDDVPKTDIPEEPTEEPTDDPIDDPYIDIPEEEVPKTGDHSYVLWIIAAAISGTLFTINRKNRRRTMKQDA